jgi:hypothetical protein
VQRRRVAALRTEFVSQDKLVSEDRLQKRPSALVPEVGGLETYSVMPIDAFTFVAMTASCTRGRTARLQPLMDDIVVISAHAGMI